jgi:molybdate transport system ATP-binding protein
MMSNPSHSPDLSPVILQANLDDAIPGRFQIRLDLSTTHRLNVLTGPSGSGKTTILKLIAGWTESKSSIYLNGSRLDQNEHGKKRPLADRSVGMVFQDDLLFPHLDVLANLEFGLRRQGGKSAITGPEFQQLIDQFGVRPLLKSRVQQLSGGERQRVGLVRALACQPRLLLCDEPVSAIDRESRRGVVRRLVDWVHQNDACLVYVTHDPEEIELLGQQIWQIDNGKLCN